MVRIDGPMSTRLHRMAWLLMAVTFLSACGEDPVPLSGDQENFIYANRVVAYNPVLQNGVTELEWPYFFHPENALAAPDDAFGVVSLGYDPSGEAILGGSITLGFGEITSTSETPATPINACAVDGDGADFSVYENPFATKDPKTGTTIYNTEVATVEVAQVLPQDGGEWFLFPPIVDETLALGDPDRYKNLAGVTTIAEGGDLFDLADLIAHHDLTAGFLACYIRLTDGGSIYADYGNTQTDQHASGADINAVEVFHSQELGQ